MKILFLGDSITEGVLGVNYIDEIKETFPHDTFVNRGVGGDSVVSLHRRINKMPDLNEFDQIVLFIGVNDVYGKLTKTYKLLKTLRRQPWSMNSDDFIIKYKELLDDLYVQNKNIVIIPPLVIGEDESNVWNQELIEYEIRIELLVKNYDGVVYLDVHKEFFEVLSSSPTSDYLPLRIRDLKKDLDSLKTNQLVDQKSLERGLHLTLDGVHLNSEGAHIVAKHIIKHLQNA